MLNKVRSRFLVSENFSVGLILFLVLSALLLAACGDITPAIVSSVPSHPAALSSPPPPSTIANSQATSPTVAPTTTITTTVSTPPATSIPVSPGTSTSTAPTRAVSPAIKTITPEQAVEQIKKQGSSVDPLLLPATVPAGYMVTRLENTSNGFEVEYTGPGGEKVTLQVVVPNPPPPGPNGSQANRSFRGVKAFYQIDDTTQPTAQRFLIWTEPGSRTGQDVPYMLSSTGLNEAAFWKIANSLEKIAAPPVTPASVNSNQAENEAINNLKTYYAALDNQDFDTAYTLVIRPNRGADDQLEFSQEHQIDSSIQNLTDLKIVQPDPAKGNLVLQITIHFFPKNEQATPVPVKNIPLTGDNVRYVEMVKDGGIWRIAQTLAVPITYENSFVTTQARPPVVQQILDFSFINASQGWVAGSYCTPFGYCQVVVKMTTDGGRSWQARHGMNAEPTYFMDDTSNHKKVGGIFFVSATDGWLFGPGLFSTHNGGASWQDEKFSEDVIELTSAGSKILAVTRSCPQPPNGTNCKYGLLSSTDNGRSWQRMPGLPAIPGPDAQLLTSTANDFWLLSWGTAFDPSDKTPPAPTLAVTHDSGKSWQTLTNPCQEDNWINARLSANSQELWLLCASTPATAQQLKYFYLSHDGGKIWQKVGSKEGTVSGYNSSFATSGSGKLWLFSTRYTLMTSGDGGQNWKIAIPMQVLNPGDGGVGPVKFLDANHGWVGGAQGQIFLTTDGGANWIPVNLN